MPNSLTSQPRPDDTTRGGPPARWFPGLRVGALRVGALLAGEVAAVVALHRLGAAPGFAPPGGDVGRWLHDTAPVDAVAAVLRLVALGCAWWLLASTVAYLVAGLAPAARARRRASATRPVPEAARVARGSRALEVLTHPGVRRLVDAALALTVVGGATLAGPAATAAPPSPPPTVTTAPAVVLHHPDHRPSAPTPPGTVRAGRAGLAQVPATASPSSPAPPVTTVAPRASAPAPTPARPATSATPPTTTTTPGSATVAPDPFTVSPGPASPGRWGSSADASTNPPAVVGAPDTAPEAQPATHVVAAGENLWSIAADRVAGATGRPRAALRPADVAPYWQALCDANRGTVRSGNLSLVYPGEVVELPAR
jgi:hypothetical protein